MSLDGSLTDDAFGRFLIKQANEWREIGAEVERERIIKILKKNSSDLGWIQLEIHELIDVIERQSK